MLPQVKPVSSAGVWADAVNREVRTQASGISKDNLTIRSHNGTTFRLKTLAKINPLFLQIPTAYDYDEVYGIGDLVYITTGQQPYWNAYEFINGVWCCVKNVPSNKFATDGNVPDEYKRTAGINYYPQWPMPAEEERYWLLISMYPEEMTICENRVNKTFWVAATQQSGSI